MDLEWLWKHTSTPLISSTRAFPRRFNWVRKTRHEGRPHHSTSWTPGWNKREKELGISTQSSLLFDYHAHKVSCHLIPYLPCWTVSFQTVGEKNKSKKQKIKTLPPSSCFWQIFSIATRAETNTSLLVSPYVGMFGRPVYELFKILGFLCSH